VPTINRPKQVPAPDRTVGRELCRADPQAREVRAEPAISPNRQVPAIQSSPPSFARSHRARRYLGWTTACAVLVLVATPIGLWIHYQSAYVMSRNAMVRGHLSEIGTRLEGVVTRVEVDAGERVTAGQILAHLEDRHFRAEAQEAQAELEGLQRELEVERSAIIYEERRLQNQLEEAAANLEAAAAQVAAAESQADDARAFHKARNSLLATGAIPSEEVRNAQAKSRTADALAKAAKAEHAAAQSTEQRARLDSDGFAIRKQRIGVLEAGVRRAQARLTAAHADLEGALIRAPADGAVVRRIVEPGGSVDVGQPIMSLRLGDDVWIEAWIDEDDIAEVNVGSVAKVTLQSFPKREFTGVVDKIGLTTDFEMPPSEVPQPRFARMRGAPVVGVGIRLQNPPAELLPGLSVVVGISKSTL
jgi:membrane fusion protein, multidrug efflux system